MNRVKNTILIFNDYFYNEIDLDSYNKENLIISNTNLCDIKINILTNEFKINLKKVDNYWIINESENVIYVIDGVKITRKKLCHGDMITILDKNKNEIFNINFILDFTSGKEDYSKEVNIQEVNEVKIGSALDNHIILNDPLVNDYHCILKMKDNIRIIEDLNSKYNVYINGNKVITKSILTNNDFIIICGYKLLYKDEKIYCPRKNVTINQSMSVKYSTNVILDYPEFIRTPRLIWKLPDEKISIVAPPKKEKKQGAEVFINLIPTLGMSLMVLIMPFGNPIYRIGMLGVTVFSTIFMFIYNSIKSSKSIKKRNNMYIEYLEKKEKEITELYDKQKYVLNKLFPNVNEACEVIETFDRRLWEKSWKDEDFLKVYLGQGALDISFTIDIPKEEFGDREDEFLMKPRELKDRYSKLYDVPISLNLIEDGRIGVIGTESGIFTLAKNIILEIAVFHYYEDVNFVCLCNENSINNLIWMRWLPHIWSSDKKVRFMGYGKESCHAILDVMNSIISKREETKAKNLPHYVLIITDASLIENEAISKYLELDDISMLNISIIYLYGKMELIPKQCKAILEVDDNFIGRYIDVNNSGASIEFKFDKYDDYNYDQLARRLAPVYVKKNYSDSILPSKISLYDIYGVNNARELNIEDRWNTNDVTKSIQAPLGLNISGNIIDLDLHEKVHGPHGLVAGTTGSGKSELLQTIIISLAINYPPNDISFILIDYKGGGMANLFLKIPHLIGTITNLDGNLVNRSLTLIKSELKRRQKIFAKYEVNHIDGYKKIEKKDSKIEKLPHLIIIADEFAELKRDQPEFMKELVSTARIGRSLGVHLILATQKPAGVVDSQIWSNSKFKLCLKVQDESDSKEMLKKPDAAFIVEPGRGYLQVGNDEYYELIQTAWSGAEKYLDEDISTENIEISEVSIEGIRKPIFSSLSEYEGKEKITQLDEIVNYIEEFSMYKGYKRCDKCWTEPLENSINLKSLISEEKYFYNRRGSKKIINPVVGEIDYPNLLKKELFTLNFSECGNVVMIGGSGYGKSTFIQTTVCSIITQYTPEEVNIYILDFASRILKVFEEAPHIGDVIFVDDSERVNNLLKMLSKEIERRKVLFSDNGASSLINYIEATNKVIPNIIIFIDNFSEYKESYGDTSEELNVIMREGPSYGINFIITNSNSSCMNYKMFNNFKTKMCLTCNDKGEYSNILGFSRVEHTKIKGRALIKMDEIYEVQIAKYGDYEKEFETIKEIKGLISSINNQYSGKKAEGIKVVPKTLNYDEVMETLELDRDSMDIPVGFNIQELENFKYSLINTSVFTIIGESKSGKTNMLKNIIYSIYQNNVEIYIIDSSNRKLKQFGDYRNVEKYGDNNNDYLSIIETLINEGERRKDLVLINGENVLVELPYIVVIIDEINNLINNVDKKIIDLFDNVIKIYKRYKFITIVTGSDSEIKASLYSVKILKSLKEFQTGILFNSISNQSFYNNIKLGYGNKEREFQVGEGYLIINNKYTLIKTSLCNKNI